MSQEGELDLSSAVGLLSGSPWGPQGAERKPAAFSVIFTVNEDRAMLTPRRSEDPIASRWRKEPDPLGAGAGAATARAGRAGRRRHADGAVVSALQTQGRVSSASPSHGRGQMGSWKWF